MAHRDNFWMRQPSTSESTVPTNSATCQFANHAIAAKQAIFTATATNASPVVPIYALLNCANIPGFSRPFAFSSFTRDSGHCTAT